MSMSRDEALAKLKGAPVGTFVIRPSDKSYAALSMVKKDDGSLYHQHIDEVPGGYQLRKTSSVHPDLLALIGHYSSPSQGDLPAPLLS